MDLDAKTPAKCAEVCQAKAVANPKVQHDPNLYVKVAKGKFIEAKSAVKVTNCFPPETQLRLAQEFAMALHQNRGSDLPTLRGALLNVLQHAYNDHSNCAKYFNCPCAPGRKTPRTASKYKGGEWLSEAGQAGAGGPAKLRKILDDKFAKLTTDVHLIALLHMNDTQVCKAFNSLHASIHPKRKDLSKTVAGKARFYAAIARSNDGLVASVKAVLAKCGLGAEHLNQVLNLVLGPIEEDNERERKRKATIIGKARRVTAKKRRASINETIAGQAGAYGANSAFDAPTGGRGRGRGRAQARGRGRTPGAWARPWAWGRCYSRPALPSNAYARACPPFSLCLRHSLVCPPDRDEEEEEEGEEEEEEDGESVEAPSESEEEEEYEVGAVHAVRDDDDGDPEYLVQWAPPYEKEFTWEPAEHLKGLRVFDVFLKAQKPAAGGGSS